MKISALKVLATAAFAAIVASPVSAADMAVKARPPIVEIWSWTGFYIGGNVGYSWGRSDTDVTYINTDTGLPIVPPPGSITSASYNMDGFVGRRPGG